MMDADQKTKLLALVKDGHDSEAAAAALNVPLAEVTSPGPRLAAALKEASKVGTARLRSKAMDLALVDGDLRFLERQLDRRDQQFQDGGISTIQRVIIDPAGRCPRCGYDPKDEAAPVPSHERRQPREENPGALPIETVQETNSHEH